MPTPEGSRQFLYALGLLFLLNLLTPVFGIQYDGESISWGDCKGVDQSPVPGRRLECSSITVPMDHFTPAESASDKTFTVPLMRLRGINATHNLLLNPGGPGNPGLSWLPQYGQQLSDMTGSDYHLLTFDPRGVGSSRPLASCSTTSEHAVEGSPAWPGLNDVQRDSCALHAWAANYVRACADTMGPHGAYVNSPQTATDMNRILDAVGQARLYFLGLSYGSILAQTYASMYPARVGRVVADAVVDQPQWYGQRLQTTRWTDTDAVFDGFLDECVRAGERCALTALATTKAALRRRVLAFAAGLKTQPVPVYVNSSVNGVLDYETFMFNGLFTILADHSSWSDFATLAAKAMQGDAAPFWTAFSGYLFPLPGDVDMFIESNDGLSGPDYWPQGLKPMLKDSKHMLDLSIFAPTDAKFWYAHQQWKVPRTHHFTPEKEVNTPIPLLFLSSSHDPLCPLASAKEAQKVFRGSQVVEAMGYGHGALPLASPCVIRHLREYLRTGIVPAEYTRCKVTGAYFR